MHKWNFCANWCSSIAKDQEVNVFSSICQGIDCAFIQCLIPLLIVQWSAQKAFRIILFGIIILIHVYWTFYSNQFMKVRNYLLTINTNVWWKAKFSVYMTLLLYLSTEESFFHWPVIFNIAKLHMLLKNKKFSKPIKTDEVTCSADKDCWVELRRKWNQMYKTNKASISYFLELSLGIAKNKTLIHWSMLQSQRLNEMTFEIIFKI